MDRRKANQAKPHENEDLQLIIRHANKEPALFEYLGEHPEPYSAESLWKTLAKKEFLTERNLTNDVTIEVIRRNLRYLLSNIVKGEFSTDNEAFRFFETVPAYREEILPDGTPRFIPDCEEDRISLAVMRSLRDETNRQHIYRCEECKNYYIAKKVATTNKFCSNRCRNAYSNRRRKKSGEHAKYMREARRLGKYQ
jgi:hypothetical protein